MLHFCRKENARDESILRCVFKPLYFTPVMPGALVSKRADDIRAGF